MQTILVIDDDESLRDTIGVMLEQEGFRAELAAALWPSSRIYCWWICGFPA